MKALILLLITNISFAATFIDVDKFESYHLTQAKEVLASFEDELNHGDFVLYSWAKKITFRRSSEKIENSIKQIIYTEYTNWSAPDDVDAVLITKDQVAKELDDIVGGLLDYYSDWNHDHIMVEKIEKQVLKLTSILSKDYDGIQVYSIGHGNSFGGASGIVAYNKRTQELLFIEAVYSE